MSKDHQFALERSLELWHKVELKFKGETIQVPLKTIQKRSSIAEISKKVKHRAKGNIN